MLYKGDWLSVRAMTRTNGLQPALLWWEGLEKKGKGQFLAAVQVLETTLRSGRPPAGRAEKVRGSKNGLWELKVTKPGSKPPHLRAIYRLEGRVLWVAIGFSKQKNKLEQADVDQAENVTNEWPNGR